eukprot:GHVR01192793.1.p1 GENE.GHVR01192793.1~~GHVR01192793.1.p1  ORF type:complete len:808 (+),score=169.05 GHVR01192793.1:61-2484(+)
MYKLLYVLLLESIKGWVNDPPKVKLSGGGIVTGVLTLDVNVYYSIPFATVPERFAPPTISDGSNNVDATYIKPACHQILSGVLPDGLYPSPPLSDDCLSISVFVPLSIKDMIEIGLPIAIPVVAWLHPGSFLAGGGTTVDTLARQLAYDSRTIVVLVNYRLGIFGWLRTSPLYGGIQGNMGFLDQVTALKFIKRELNEVASLANNSIKVTLWGSSSGGMSAMCHLSSPYSRGLFHHAIISSGSGGKTNTRKFMEDLGEVSLSDKPLVDECGTPKSPIFMQCVKEVDPSILLCSQTVGRLWAMVQDPFYAIHSFSPTVDGDIIPQDCYETHDTNTSIPVWFTNVENEGGYLLAMAATSIGNGLIDYFTATGLQAAFYRDDRQQNEQAFSAYEFNLQRLFMFNDLKDDASRYRAPSYEFMRKWTMNDRHSALSLASELLGDLYYFCSIRHLSGVYAIRGHMVWNSIFSYGFSYVPNRTALCQPELTGPNLSEACKSILHTCSDDDMVCHVTEIPFVFQPKGIMPSQTLDQRQEALVFALFLENFGTNGNPNVAVRSTPVGGEWPNITATDALTHRYVYRYLGLRPPKSHGSYYVLNPREEKCFIWDKLTSVYGSYTVTWLEMITGRAHCGEVGECGKNLWCTYVLDTHAVMRGALVADFTSGNLNKWMGKGFDRLQMREREGLECRCPPGFVSSPKNTIIGGRVQEALGGTVQEALSHLNLKLNNNDNIDFNLDLFPTNPSLNLEHPDVSSLTTTLSADVNSLTTSIFDQLKSNTDLSAHRQTGFLSLGDRVMGRYLAPVENVCVPVDV